MKNLKMYISILLALVLVAILPLNAFSQGKPVELRLAHIYPSGTFYAGSLDRWAEKIKKDSNGLLTVRVFPANTLLNVANIISGVVSGTADIGSCTVMKPEGFELSSVMSFVLTAPDMYTAVKIYDEIWKQFPEAMANEWRNVKVLWLNPIAPQTYWFKSKNVQTLADWKGLQIRVPSQEVAAHVTAMGGTPVYMSTADLAVSLDKGTVDGCAQMWTGVFAYKMSSLKYAVKLKNDSLLGLPTPCFVIMNKDSYNKLDPSLKKVIDDNLKWGRNTSIEAWATDHKQSEAYVESYGGKYISLSPEEEAKWLAIRNQVQTKIMQALDAKGLPASAILKFIHERVQYYAK